MNLADKITHLKPCNEGKAWLSQYTNKKTAWNNCNEPEWMVWYIDKTSGEVGSVKRKKLVKTLFDIASLCKPYEDEQTESLRQAVIKVGYLYCEDKASLNELTIARNKLWDDSAAYNAACDAYYAAAYAVYATYYAVYAAAYAEKAGVTKEKQLEIIRQNYPKPPEL